MPGAVRRGDGHWGGYGALSGSPKIQHQSSGKVEVMSPLKS